MKLYITARYKGVENKKEVEKLCRLVRSAGFEDVWFTRDVENFKKVFDDPRDLMQRSKEEILKCDALLLDVSDNPSGGRLIEAGIAYAADKSVIIIAKKNVNIKTTTSGIAEHIIYYDELSDIVAPLKKICTQ